MADPQVSRSWAGRVLFALVCLAIIFAQILPLGTAPRGWTGPDMLLGITLVWVVRRPDLVPVALIAAIFLIADLLAYRPPGLWTALVVVATEILRARVNDMRAMSFPMEWLTVTGTVAGLFLAYRAFVMVLFLPQNPLTLTFEQMFATILIYPVIALAAYYGFGVTRHGMGEIDEMGRRL